ncbi:MAG: hypothetical protein WCV50_01435 [Patescibacteria group bacterium]|jgi:hypothetical protein
MDRVFQLDDTPSEALAVYCGDPRFRKAFESFIKEVLGINNYTRIGKAGGVHAFGGDPSSWDQLRELKEEIRFFIMEGGLKRVILFGHDDCQWYKLHQSGCQTNSFAEKGKVDLQIAAAAIREENRGVSVCCYYASLNGNEITFEEVK